MAIYDVLRQVRDYINEPWMRFSLVGTPEWYQVTSSLDMIEDMEQAIRAYEELEEPSQALLYLATVGVLQSLFVQQDAVTHLIEGLGYSADSFVDASQKAVLKDIREIRNQAIGHPTKRDRPKPTQYNYIIQHSLSARGFDILFYWEDGSQGSRSVDVTSLIAQQRLILKEILEKVRNSLEQQILIHKGAFKEEKLTEYFETAPYFCQKVAEAVVVDDTLLYSLGLGGLDNVVQALNDFRGALERRNPMYLKELERKYDLLLWAIQRVRSFLEARQNGEESEVPREEAEIYSEFICANVNDLQEMAREIDLYYEEA